MFTGTQIFYLVITTMLLIYFIVSKICETIGVIAQIRNSNQISINGPEELDDLIEKLQNLKKMVNEIESEEE